MRFSNIIFPELHNWAFATGGSAVLLVVSTVFLWIAKRAYHRNVQGQVVIFLLIIGIGIWSLIIALDGYQQWLSIVHHAPAHGFFTYARAINEDYVADVFRCQVQFAATAIPLVVMFFMLGWEILPHVLHRVGEVKSEVQS